MSNDLNISLEDLIDSQREIADLIGLDNYIKLVRYYGGDSPYIQTQSKLIKSSRNSKIREAADGYNVKELARQHGLSVRHLYNIVPRDIRVKKRAQPLDGQIKLY